MYVCMYICMYGMNDTGTAVSSDGKLYAWGRGGGRLSDTDSPVPTLVSSLNRLYVTMVSVGDDHLGCLVYIYNISIIYT